ncbi:MAG: hypothetical protein JO094_06630 [Hyphomicrobiales bacterium]|nr:hypothetical protein [Hyphomicrobiales bacterium]MBV9051915.1 hypothetical protein [Hyphomicrobiales bacterium]MBV9590850.1 hypothetical protein [Hyphomicrobiales bacterium]
MNFLELVFTVCAIGNANLCEDKYIALQDDVHLAACVMQAQPTLAQWASANPDWTITGWRCDYSSNRKEKI